MEVAERYVPASVGGLGEEIYVRRFPLKFHVDTQGNGMSIRCVVLPATLDTRICRQRNTKSLVASNQDDGHGLAIMEG